MAGRRNNDHFRSTVSQLLASLLFSQVNAGLGLVLAMPTILIGALRSDSSALGLSEEQASWFGSLVYMVQPIGSVLSGFLQDVCGRRKCLMLINIPMLVGWLIIYHATSVTHLFIAELIMGLSIGFMEAPIVSYIGEITQPRLRGVLSSLGAIFYNGGIMVESFLGAAMPWRDMVFYSALAPVASFIMLALVSAQYTDMYLLSLIIAVLYTMPLLKKVITDDVPKLRIRNVVHHFRYVSNI